MNNDRRKRIRDKVIAHLDLAYAALDEIKEEEEAASDNIPESMDEKREKSEEMVSTLEVARDDIECTKNELAEMIGDDG